VKAPQKIIGRILAIDGNQKNINSGFFRGQFHLVSDDRVTNVINLNCGPAGFSFSS